MKGDLPDPLDLIGKFAALEKELDAATVMAPVLPGGLVRVRVAGAIYELSVDDTEYDGWALLKIVAPGRATIVSRPTALEIAGYLKLFPKLRFVLLDRFRGIWWGILAAPGPRKVTIDGAVPVRMAEAASRFQTALVRLDGSQFYYECEDRRRSPIYARYLRDAIEREIVPDEISLPGLIPAEKLAYKILYLNLNPGWKSTRDQMPSPDRRIRNALRNADAQFDSYWSLGEDLLSVRFQIDGETHHCQVRGSDLSLVSAGICLSGRDRDFDLSTLVSVLREHKRRRGV